MNDSHALARIGTAVSENDATLFMNETPRFPQCVA